MTLGSMIEADSRLRAHEWRVRQNKKLARDAAVWRRYEEEYERKGVPAVGGESRGSQQQQGRGVEASEAGSGAA